MMNETKDWSEVSQKTSQLGSLTAELQAATRELERVMKDREYAATHGEALKERLDAITTTANTIKINPGDVDAAPDDGVVRMDIEKLKAAVSALIPDAPQAYRKGSSAQERVNRKKKRKMAKKSKKANRKRK